jgi:hypothetical protein
MADLKLMPPESILSEIDALRIHHSLADAALARATPAQIESLASRLRDSLPEYVAAIARHEEKYTFHHGADDPKFGRVLDAEFSAEIHDTDKIPED